MRKATVIVIAIALILALPGVAFAGKKTANNTSRPTESISMSMGRSNGRTHDSNRGQLYQRKIISRTPAVACTRFDCLPLCWDDS